MTYIQKNLSKTFFTRLPFHQCLVHMLLLWRSNFGIWLNGRQRCQCAPVMGAISAAALDQWYPGWPWSVPSVTCVYACDCDRSLHVNNFIELNQSVESFRCQLQCFAILLFFILTLSPLTLCCGVRDLFRVIAWMHVYRSCGSLSLQCQRLWWGWTRNALEYERVNIDLAVKFCYSVVIVSSKVSCDIEIFSQIKEQNLYWDDKTFCWNNKNVLVVLYLVYPGDGGCKFWNPNNSCGYHVQMMLRWWQQNTVQ